MKKKRHNYRNLKIWKEGIEIANTISDLLQEFPKHEKYDLSSQMSRCSVSIASNIVEGSARSDKSFSHFIDMALGSSFELSTQLEIAKYRDYLSDERLKSIQQKITEFQQMTFGFQNQLGN